MFIRKFILKFGIKNNIALVSSTLHLEKILMLHLGFTYKTNPPLEFEDPILSLKHLHSHVTISSQHSSY